MGPDFSRTTIDALSRRAALRCNNPDCDRLTTGPNTDSDKATNIGEAAHIFGARPRSARYRAELLDVERAAISNAIWLCSGCHGLVDKDEARYGVELLLLWRANHEEKILRELGTPGDRVREMAEDKELAAFSHLPTYIQQIIKDRSEFWEYMLTAELLDHYLKPVLRRARDLQRNLISRPWTGISGESFVPWAGIKTEELISATASLKANLAEIQAAWGDPGEPGDPHEIEHACRLFVLCAEHFVLIGEEARFTRPPEGFEGVTGCLSEGALHALNHMPELPAFIRSIFEAPDPKGRHEFSLVLDLPPGWNERFEEELARGQQALEERGYQR